MAAALLVGGVVGAASLELSAGPAAGTELNGAPATGPVSPRTIRVGLYNIHGAKGLDGRRDLGRIADLLEGLDFIGLNEVHQRWTTGNQAEILGKTLGMQWLFTPTERCWSGEHFGSAILSRVPIDSWQRIPLASPRGDGYRNVVLVRIPHQHETLNVLVTHIDPRKDRESQLRAVLSLFLSLDEPAVLMGDLNTRADDPQIVELLKFPGVTDCVSACGAPNPKNRIDWIFTRGLRCVQAGLKETIASDHPRIWAELELPAAATPGKE